MQVHDLWKAIPSTVHAPSSLPLHNTLEEIKIRTIMLAYLVLSAASTQIISGARQDAQIAVESACMWRHVFL